MVTLINNPPTSTQQEDTNPLQSQGLNPDPRSLISEEGIQLVTLKRLAGQSIVSAEQFDKPLVLELCKFAALLEATEIASSHPLDGKIVVTAFFEPSTRTRLSFESAVLRLDGKVISIPDGRTSGLEKGESLTDMGEMLNAYGDLVVMRHTETQALEDLTINLRLPIINAGNGSGEHPTQALADWYAILKWYPGLKQPSSPQKKLNIGIMGTPGNMRAVKSFLLMSLLFHEGIESLSIVSEMADPLGPELQAAVEASGITYNTTVDINDVVPELDVIYMNSISFLGDSYKVLDQKNRLDTDSPLKPGAVILHPLARLDELSPTLDRTEHNLYFTQAHGAVYIRQALLISIFDRFDRLPRTIPIRQ